MKVWRCGNDVAFLTGFCRERISTSSPADNRDGGHNLLLTFKHSVPGSLALELHIATDHLPLHCMYCCEHWSGHY